MRRRKVIDQITVNYDPSQVVISPDAKRAYVLDELFGGATVSVIDITGAKGSRMGGREPIGDA